MLDIGDQNTNRVARFKCDSDVQSKNGFDQNDLRKKLSYPFEKPNSYHELPGKSHTRPYDMIWANHNLRLKYDRGFQSKIGFCQNNVCRKLSYPKQTKNSQR